MLRTSARARDFAIKPLVEALASPESHAPLGRLLARKPDWEDQFWLEFARNPVSVPLAADFLENSSLTADRIPEGPRRELYTSLRQRSLFSTLYRVAALDRKAGAGSQELAAGKFVTTANGNALGWTLHSEGSFSVGVHQRTDELQIDARGGAFGIAADRVAPVDGSRRVTITMAEPVPSNAAVKLAVQCADGSKRELTSVSLRSGQRGGQAVFSADGCGFVNIELSFNVESGRRDALIRVARIVLGSA
jgi:hypothetical protein